LTDAGLDASCFQYFSLYNEVSAEAVRQRTEQLTLAVNELNVSTTYLVKPTKVTPDGRVVRFCIDDLGLARKDLEWLGKNGSGDAPFPEPYFHRVLTATIEEEYTTRDWWPGGLWQGTYYREGWYDNKRTRQKFQNKILQPKHLPRVELDTVIRLTRTDFPVFRADWFTVYSGLPPAYLRFLGNPQTVDDVRTLAGLDKETYAKQSQDVGIGLRGTALHSKVARHNRAAERRPTPYNRGRGIDYETFDFKTSLNADDVTNNLLVHERDAGETFFTLRNGLLGWIVINGNKKNIPAAERNKVLQQADPNIVVNYRTGGPQDVAIRSGPISCGGCHMKGIVAFNDDARLQATTGRGFTNQSLRTKYKVDDLYFSEDLGLLIAQDQQNYARQVVALTGSLPEAVHLGTDAMAFAYLEGQVSPDGVCLETGYPPTVVGPVIQEAGRVGLDHVFVGMLSGRNGRRDQFERGFGQMMEYLVTLPIK
jgi:hypothetical protein